MFDAGLLRELPASRLQQVLTREDETTRERQLSAERLEEARDEEDVQLAVAHREATTSTVTGKRSGAAWVSGMK